MSNGLLNAHCDSFCPENLPDVKTQCFRSLDMIWRQQDIIWGFCQPLFDFLETSQKCEMAKRTPSLFFKITTWCEMLVHIVKLIYMWFHGYWACARGSPKPFLIFRKIRQTSNGEYTRHYDSSSPHNPRDIKRHFNLSPGVFMWWKKVHVMWHDMNAVSCITWNMTKHDNFKTKRH